MPKGSPNAQTIATEKYQKKVGYISKSYKLKRELVEQFEDACMRADVSQAGKISELMKSFIEEVNTTK
ncbi:MAG: chemotaxis protein [Lachnospiraceae bacterium]|nr:chemotaxis protein [Lachnospiraceae bacterium]